jgi:hypothetical protein
MPPQVYGKRPNPEPLKPSINDQIKKNRFLQKGVSSKDMILSMMIESN